MTRSPRWVRRLALGLAALVLMASTAVRGRPAAPTHAEADPWAPADCGLLVVINVRQVAAAPLVQKYAREELSKALARTQRIGKALQAASLDLLRDIDRITLAVSGDLLHPHVLGIVRGHFDAARARAAAAEYARQSPTELQIENANGRALYHFRAEHHEVFAIFDGSTLILATSREHLAAALPASASLPAPRTAAMQEALGKLSGQESAWLALVVAEPMKETLKRKDPQSAELIASLQCVTGSIDVTDALSLVLTAYTATPQAALQLRKKVDNVVPLLQFFAAGNDVGARLLRDAVAGIRVENQHNAVRVTLQVSEDMIQKAKKD